MSRWFHPHGKPNSHGAANAPSSAPMAAGHDRGGVASPSNQPITLPPPPAALKPYLMYPPAIEPGQSFTVYIDARQGGSPLLLSWLRDVERLGLWPKVEKVSAADLAARIDEEQNRAGAQNELNLEMLNFARRLIMDCAIIGGSDLHIMVREKYAEIQLRVKGSLKTAERYSMRHEEGEALVRAIYTGLASVKEATYKPRDFQDAQISGDALAGSGLSSVRIIRGPCYPVDTGGGFLVARLQYHRSHAHNAQAAVEANRRLGLNTPARPPGEFALAKMGYTPQQVEMVDRLLRRPMGIIVVTGPTGSGKTTTLFECTNHQARLFPHKRIDTIENPPEYPMSWAVQLATESDRFPEMLRMTLRMDPNCILLGEIRGVEEAVAALQAAMTGHMVLSTLHVTDPFETFSRLEMLDHVRLSRPIICNHRQVIGLISQRIVPLLCPHCSVPLAQAYASLPAYMLKALQSWGDLSRVRLRGQGCEHCHGEIVVGRRAVAEVVVTDEALMIDCVQLGVLAASRNHRKKPGSDKPMIAHAMDLVLSGKLDPTDAEGEVDEIPHKETVL